MSDFKCRLCGYKEYAHNYDNYYCLGCGVEFKNQYMFTLPIINVKKLSDDAIIPTKAKKDDVGYDLYSVDDTLIQSGEIKLIKTDIAIELPYNTEAQIRSRSGMGKKGIIVANQPGTIDTGYRGMCGVLLYNTTKAYYHVRKGDKIAQMLITVKLPYDFVLTEKLSETERGDKGFNSTGR